MSQSSLLREARHRAAAPTRLGLTLRSVALVPRAGYAAAFRTSERRARAAERPAEGYAPYVLALLGGVAAMALWLKLGGLAGWRGGRASAGSDVLFAALALGAPLSVGAQFLWGAVGPPAAARLGGAAEARDLRLAWGASALPQAFVVLVLLTLDLAIVGPAAFAGAPLADPVARAWAALSLAGAGACAAWSSWLFVRGVEVASGLGLLRAAGLAAVAGACALVSVAPLLVAGALLPGS